MSKYTPYPKYKDSGVEWLGKFPEHWATKKLKFLAPLHTEKSNSDTFKIALENIESWTGRLVFTDTIFEGEGFSFKEGDILFGKLRPYLAKVYTAKNPGSAVGDFHVLRPLPLIKSEFLENMLRTSEYIDIVHGSTYGAKMPRVSWEFMGNSIFPLPPIVEQEQIISFLGHEISHIDTIIAKQEQLIKLLEEKRIALISYAVSKGLNPDCEMKDSGIEWIGHIPKDWSVTRLKFVAHVQTGIAKGKSYINQTTICVPYLRVANVQNGFLSLETIEQIEIKEEELQRYSLRIGDVLMNEGGDFDKLGRGTIWRGEIENCIHQNHVFAVRPHAVTSGWLNLWASSSCAQFYFMSLSKQSTNLASISSSNLMELPLVLPPADEQSAILSYVTLETEKIDNIIEKTKQAIALAQERRAAIISAAVTGKICVFRPQSAEKPLSRSREYFQKVVLAAEITNQLHPERTFGRVKLQKVLFLSEYHAQLPFQRSEYQRYAAGPHDPKAMYAIEGQMKKQKWFDSRLRKSGYGKEYVPLERHEAYKQYYERYFADKHAVIQRLIDLLRPKDTQFCEVVATLYGVWNDFLLAEQHPSDADMFREAVTNWHDKKREIPTGLWPKALRWMRENDLVPTGWGEPTIHRQEA